MYNMTTKKLVEYPDTIWYYIDGTGCFDSNGPAVQSLFQDHTKIPYENIKYRCPRTSSALKTIVKTYLRRNPLEDSGFLRRVTGEIFADLVNPGGPPLYKNVVVFGESYGGAIVNRVAEKLNETLRIHPDLEEYFERLSMATFGSIYIPTDGIDKINIINYVSVGDVAIKCNHIETIQFRDMPYFFVMDTSNDTTVPPYIICKLPVEDQTTKTKQVCLYNKGYPMCLNRKNKNKNPSIVSWSEHTGYIYIMFAIFKNFRSKNVKNFINIYDSSHTKVRFYPYLTEDLPDATAGGKRYRTRRNSRRGI